MRALITGITGFAGSHLADYILETHPEVEVYGLVRWRSRMENIRHILDRVHLQEADLKDMVSMKKALAEIEPDFIKFDMSLIRGIDTNPVRQNLIRNMRAFADDLEIKVVAEGVETRSQFDALVDLDIDMIQGYFVAPPLPAEDAEKLLERTADSPNHLHKILSDRMQGVASPPPSSS